MKIVLNECQVRMLAENMKDIDREAGRADRNPTEKQKGAGNYRMGHVNFAGFQITIENARGSRRYYGKDGEYTLMKNHYGYFTKTKGRDGDQVDVFLGPNEDSDKVYVVDQNDSSGEFDESKVMLGFSSKKEAKKAYMSNFSKDWKGFGHITGVSRETFRKWLYTGRKQRKPFCQYVLVKNNLAEGRLSENSEDEDVAYHGTDADFDKFDFAYMGTGAGAQYRAYGSYLSTSYEGADAYGSNVYKVNYPDDNGRNYLYADGPISESDAGNITNAICEYMRENYPDMYGDDRSYNAFYDEVSRTIKPGTIGDEVYGDLEAYLGSQEEVSEFLYKKAGKVGLKYKDRDNVNIVIFNPDDIRILEKNPGRGGSNSQMNAAKKNRNDEFYTRMDSIAEELSNYADRFRGKVVFCNCDNPEFSNFYRYFKENFSKFGLKMLVSTGMGVDGTGKYGLFDGRDEDTGDLSGDGSFTGEESRKYLRYADIVVTNPPFTQFREYLDMLLAAGKDFIILGNMNAVKNKDTYRYFIEGKVRTGYSGFNKGMYFNVPDGFRYGERYSGKREIDGQSVARVPGVCWFTNMFDEKPVQPVMLTKTTGDSEYPEYDNYDAIEVKPYTAIPYDYDGYMGVPVTIMDKLAPDGLFHFQDPEGNELLYRPVGLMNSGEKNEGVRHPDSKSGKPIIDGKYIYSRILIHKV